MYKPMTDPLRGQGSFTIDHVAEGSRYELYNGHPVYCAPAGGDHASATSATSLVLGTDPEVEEVGTDVGYSSGPRQLRAPDVAVGNVPNKPGWVSGAPRLAVEHASRGQDEEELMAKVGELLAAGTEQVWVVRLIGPRRVEVWLQDGSTALYLPGQHISAPGILRRPVPVAALFDPEMAREAAWLNMLARHGYSDLDEVRQEGHAIGRQEGQVETLRATLLAVVEARGLALSAEARATVLGCTAPERLSEWVRRAAVASGALEI